MIREINPRQAIESAVNHDAKSAARRLNLAEQTLANWRSQRKGPPYVKIGSKIIYREKDLIAFEISIELILRRTKKRRPAQSSFYAA